MDQQLCEDGSDETLTSEKLSTSLALERLSARCTLGCVVLAAMAALIGAMTLARQRGVHVSGSVALVSQDAESQDEKVLQSYVRFYDNHSGRMQEELANGFANRPPPEEWNVRLRRGIEEGRRDPCSADVVSVMGWPAGFGWHMTSFVDDLWIAVYNGLSIALCSSDEFVDVWLSHFDNPLGIGLCRAPVCGSLSSTDFKKMAFYQGHFLTTPLARVDREYIGALKKFLLVSVYVMNERVAESVNKTLELTLTSGTSFAQSPRHYLGVHVRHGDKGREAPLLPEDAYSDVIRQYLQDHQELNLVYVATDDPQCFPILREQIEQPEGLAIVVEQERLPDDEYMDRDYTNSSSLMSLLVDIEALRRADVFIGTASSHMGKLVAFLRDPKRVSYSLDSDFDFLAPHA